MKLKKAIQVAKQWNTDNPTQEPIKYISVDRDLQLIGSNYKPILNDHNEWQACEGNNFDTEVILAATYTGSKNWKDTLREVKAMNREIKFRYWNKREMHYQDVHGMIFGYLGTNLEEQYLMQFTGLQDKNGKDVYEEDILQSPNPAFKFTVKHGLCQGGVCIGYDVSIPYNECEVIGNIYETPDT